MYLQRTLKSTVSTNGTGLHTGARVALTLRPAPPDTGIIFHRSDLPGSPALPAVPENVGETVLSTLLRVGDTTISTIEHLMSAFAGLGIDNVEVDVAGPEIPIMDGSASAFIYLLQSTGVVDQKAPKRFIKILDAVEVSQGDKWARFTPFDGFRLDFTIDFEHPVMGQKNRRVVLDFNEDSYIKEISRARTFGFMQDVETMRNMGLAMGGSLHNAVVLDETSVLNQGGLRYENEPVKHKVLDAIGDLYLLGHPIIGQYTAYKSGHGLNNQLARRLMATEKAFEWVTFRSEEEAPKAFHRWRLAAS
jgi:UDP-3-O-[3-hydroxymyristoyl] N-acetylglucosamine deacetylase